MIQELYQTAMKYAGEKHKNQLVPGTTANYLLHISNVTMEVIMAHKQDPSFDLAYAIQVAILHDTLEDTDATYGEIKELFGNKVAQGVQSLTKIESLPTKAMKIIDSLERIKLEPKEVAIVKLADRITNLQPPPSHWTLEKKRNYLNEARRIAEALAGNHNYLDERIRDQISKYSNYC